MHTNELQQVRERFLKRLPQRLEEIEACASQLTTLSDDGITLGRLEGLLHRLAGAAATFELPSLANAAREAENQIRDMPQARRHGLTPDQLEALRCAVEAVGRCGRLARTDPPQIEPATTQRVEAPTQPAVTVEGDSRTILFVDDDEHLREWAAAVLSAAGYRVLTAGDVETAMKAVYSSFPQLVITDVMMPNESGFSLCSKLRSDPATHDLPIIVVTILEEEAQALQAGATAFLSKPLDAAALRTTVSELLCSEDIRGLLNTALEEIRAERFDVGREQLIRLIKAHPTDPLARWARYYVGQLAVRDRALAIATDYFRAILDQDPQFWRAHNQLAAIYDTTHNPDLALRHYQRSLALCRDQPDIARIVADRVDHRD